MSAGAVTVSEPEPGRGGRLAEVAALFLKLGTVAFGGPAAHVAMMEDEVVRRRGWLSREDFLDLVGASNLIPGPNSTELAIHIGHRRAGWPGLLTAGLCFILPATAIVWALAWAYARYGTLPAAGALLAGVQPVILAVILQALAGLGRTALKTWQLGLFGAIAAALLAAGVHELVVLFGCGFAAAAGRRLSAGLGAALPPPVWAPLGLAAAGAAAPFQLSTLFLVFLKIGAVLFGSGYVLIAFLRTELVTRLGWLTESQLLDAVAVGQVTPGPVFTTATFIGYLLGGHAGAAAATAGIFLPAFFFVAISGPLVPRLRSSPAAGAFLDGVNAASLALLALISLQLAATALRGPAAILLAGISAILLLRYRVNATWLILGGAAAGLYMGS